MKHLTNIEQQIMLVAKGHYNHFATNKEGYKVDLLRQTIKYLCALDHVSDADLLGLVVPVFLQYCTLPAQQDAFRWMFTLGFTTKETVSQRDIITRMLGAISIIAITKDGEELFDLDPKKVIDISKVT